MKLNTVNVIHMDEMDMLQSLQSFEDNKEGNEEAEALFKKLCKEHLHEVSDEDIEIFLENGSGKVSAFGGEILLVHST